MFFNPDQQNGGVEFAPPIFKRLFRPSARAAVYLTLKDDFSPDTLTRKLELLDIMRIGFFKQMLN